MGTKGVTFPWWVEGHENGPWARSYAEPLQDFKLMVEKSSTILDQRVQAKRSLALSQRHTFVL